MRWLNLYYVTLSLLAIVMDPFPAGRHHKRFSWSDRGVPSAA